MKKLKAKWSEFKTSCKSIARNIKFMLPIFFKKSPMTLVLMILNPLVESARGLIGIIIPAEIIRCLMTTKDQDQLITLVVILVGTNFLASVFINGSNILTNYFARKVDFYIDEIINKKVMTVDYFNVEDPVFIDKLKRAQKAMNEYSNGIYSFIYSCRRIIQSFITISGVITIVLLSRQYVVIICAVIGIISNTIIYHKIQNTNQEFRNKMARNDRKLGYYNRGIADFRLQKELRLYYGRKLIEETTNTMNPPIFKEYDRLGRKFMRLNSLDSIIYFLATQLITIIYLCYAALNNDIDVATLTLLFSSISTLDSAVCNFIYSLQDYSKACSYQNDFIDLMEMESEFTDGKDSIDHISTIEFKDVSFKYPRTDKYILKNVSFKINNKQKISLVGLNGSGKTTIIKLICRFYKVEEGEILINGVNINNYDNEQYMRLLAIVFQDFKIIAFNIRSNVAITERDQDKLYDCLKRAQVLDKVLSLPEKENTYVNKWFDRTGVEFSGGEMQKFAIARCLYKNGDFIVLDEPTSALDPISEAEIYYHFNEIVGKKLTLFISHRLSSCIFSDRIMVLDGNQIVEEGTHEELMANKEGLYYQMFTAQAAYYQD